MRISVGELRLLIREAIDCWGGTRPEETYDEVLANDPTFLKRSVLVPDDIKNTIVVWMQLMGLSRPINKPTSWPR